MYYSKKLWYALRWAGETNAKINISFLIWRNVILAEDAFTVCVVRHVRNSPVTPGQGDRGITATRTTSTAF